VIAASANAASIVYEGLEGGSGDVDNVLFQGTETGNIIDAVLNTSSGSFAVQFSSTSVISGESSAGQARITAEVEDDHFTDLTIALLNGATFGKLQFNIDAVEDGTVTFLADGLPVTFAAGDDGSVGASGSNFFTLLADPGVSTFTITSTVAFNLVDVAQVRVGELSTTVIPLPAAAWSGMVLLGLLGGQRALRRLRQR
jgi:hypothetical protein